jgi:hypothetical protein
MKSVPEVDLTSLRSSSGEGITIKSEEKLSSPPTPTPQSPPSNRNSRTRPGRPRKRDSKSASTEALLPNSPPASSSEVTTPSPPTAAVTKAPRKEEHRNKSGRFARASRKKVEVEEPTDASYAAEQAESKFEKLEKPEKLEKEVKSEKVEKSTEKEPTTSAPGSPTPADPSSSSASTSTHDSKRIRTRPTRQAARRNQELSSPPPVPPTSSTEETSTPTESGKDSSERSKDKEKETRKGKENDKEVETQPIVSTISETSEPVPASATEETKQTSTEVIEDKSLVPPEKEEVKGTKGEPTTATTDEEIKLTEEVPTTISATSTGTAVQDVSEKTGNATTIPVLMDAQLPPPTDLVSLQGMVEGGQSYTDEEITTSESMDIVEMSGTTIGGGEGGDITSLAAPVIPKREDLAWYCDPESLAWRHFTRTQRVQILVSQEGKR